MGWLVVRYCPDPNDPGFLMRDLLHRHHGALHFSERAGVQALDVTVIRWMIVPEEPDDEA